MWYGLHLHKTIFTTSFKTAFHVQFVFDKIRNQIKASNHLEYCPSLYENCWHLENFVSENCPLPTNVLILLALTISFINNSGTTPLLSLTFLFETIFSDSWNCIYVYCYIQFLFFKLNNVYKKKQFLSGDDTRFKFSFSYKFPWKTTITHPPFFPYVMHWLQLRILIFSSIAKSDFLFTRKRIQTIFLIKLTDFH